MTDINTNWYIDFSHLSYVEDIGKSKQKKDLTHPKRRKFDPSPSKGSKPFNTGKETKNKKNSLIKEKSKSDLILNQEIFNDLDIALKEEITKKDKLPIQSKIIPREGSPNNFTSPVNRDLIWNSNSNLSKRTELHQAIKYKEKEKMQEKITNRNIPSITCNTKENFQVPRNSAKKETMTTRETTDKGEEESYFLSSKDEIVKEYNAFKLKLEEWLKEHKKIHPLVKLYHDIYNDETLAGHIFHDHNQRLTYLKNFPTYKKLSTQSQLLNIFNLSIKEIIGKVKDEDSGHPEMFFIKGSSSNSTDKRVYTQRIFVSRNIFLRKFNDVDLDVPTLNDAYLQD